ncbi:uncharacterized protein LOC124362114 isoform X3 [Homalodisca vitripennis]|uniref:uncharacterized protein LOC124362114 isoform X3 n=1 Tax=Homalodisca vitripennis TaxID=197043 RepID=UPI001EEAC230|nr:uncharacterized protein LOC124362114 isoform X3 [Homalodisca vitripennis]
MAPGIGGNGSGGGGGRQTGTVPKTKSHNESTREYNGASRRDYQHFNHMPNNLSSLDWQPVNDSLPHTRTRKESNTSASRYSEFDAEENTVSQDNLWFNSAQRSQAYNSDDDEVSQASWAENRYKSNNLGLPDKSQVATRLHQIRDYVSQTMSMMDSLRATGGQRNMAQHNKLANMLEGLRDSELKLQTLYERLQRIPPPPNTEGDPESFSAHQMLESPRERANKPGQSTSKPSETARRNELKKQVQVSQLKLQELQEQQATLKALRQKAQEQLNEARAAQGVLMSAHGINPDNNIQERLQNLHRFFDARHQLVQVVQGLDEEELETCEMQNKLDELQAKKQHMDQLLAQFSNNVSEDLSAEECERDVENKMAELNAMRDTLAILQSNISAQLQPQASQERSVKKEPQSRASVEKSNTTTGQTLMAKTQQLHEAKAKLQQLQNLLRTVEELRESGQPVPDSILQLMGNSHLSDHSSSPTHPDRSDMSSQELNVTQPVGERLVNACERSELYSERGCRSLNSCERERVNHQLPANAAKHNNQEDKLGTKMQLEELLRNQDLNISQPLQSSSFQENSTTTGTWGSSTQGTSTMDDNFNLEFAGDLNESASIKNATGAVQPHNVWRKPSTGSGTSRLSWTSPYVPQDVRRQQHSDTGARPRTSPPPPHSPPTTRPHPSADTTLQPDSHWVVQQISQLQNQLQQMTGLYKNFVEKQHNCPPPWMGPSNMPTALGPYCQYIASATQWQQQQLLVHSLNQCCQLIWHQQRELAALKEALRLLQQPQQEGHFPTQTDDPSSPHSNLRSTQQQSRHVALKPSLSAGPSLAPPTVVSSAHSLPNLASPQTTPTSPTPLNNRNLLSSPTATVLSLPTTLNNAPVPAPTHNPNLFFNHSSQFTDPNFINLYPPYGNNLNFEFPSPVNFFPNPPEPFLTWASSQPQPTTTLNNQVPPGNRANNYWDNFRSYSRQNLLSNSGKSNDGLPQPQAQRTPLERFLNTDTHQPPVRSRKERLNAQNRQTDNLLLSGAPLLPPPETVGDEGDLGEASGYHPHFPFQHNLCAEPTPSLGESKTQVRHQVYSPHSFQHNVCNETESQSSRLVNHCEAPRGANKRCPVEGDRKAAVNKRNYIEVTPREAKISQLNNYHTESNCEANAEAERPINLECSPHARRNPRNVNCEGNDGHCLMACDKGVRRKDNKGNVAKECKTEVNGGGDSLEECVYSEVAALISVNEWRPQFLLQLFKDLRLLSSCTDPNMQAALSSIHTLAARTSQEERGGMNDEAVNNQMGLTECLLDNPGQQPRNWSHKEAPPQLPTNCAKLDWEVRSILVEMLPFIKSQLSEVCGPALLEAIRKLILHLVPSQSTQEQLDAQLEDALHKFHGCRLGDVYEELLTVVADVLISELTFLRLVNTVHHASDQPNGEEAVEEEEEEGAVGGEVGDPLPPALLIMHPANQPRRAKSETVSEADLAEADQSRHTGSVGEEERGDTAEGTDQLEEEEASGRDLGMGNCNGNIATESKTEASWAVEQDRELGLDQVPTRLHDPTCPETEQDHSNPDPSPI